MPENETNNLSALLENEAPITLAEAQQHFPEIGGRRPSIPSIWRWAKFGIRGVHLESLCVGRRVATTREAVKRFIERSTEALQAQPPKVRSTTAAGLPPGLASEISRKRAKRILDAAGI